MQIEILKPVDGPTGRRRLLEIIKSGLANRAFDHFRMIVAFAKVGPLLRLEDAITRWRNDGKIAEAMFGFNLLGTSKQALQQAAQMLDSVYLTGNAVPNCTFHPKIYLFDGDREAMAMRQVPGIVACERPINGIQAGQYVFVSANTFERSEWRCFRVEIPKCPEFRHESGTLRFSPDKSKLWFHVRHGSGSSALLRHPPCVLHVPARGIPCGGRAGRNATPREVGELLGVIDRFKETASDLGGRFSAGEGGDHA